jgi:hypothetical protein
MGAKVQFGVLAVAGVLMALVVLSVGLLTGGRDGVSAKPLPRGSLVALPDKPAVLNGPAVVTAFNGVRGEIKAPALTRSSCLDGVAVTLAGSFNTGTVPSSAPTGCGRIDWGWVAGTDPTGKREAQAAYGRTATGPSPLIGRAAKHLGLAVGPRHESGTVTGYLLVWVVSA